IRAILDGAQQVATPAFVSTLAICIVFVSVMFLQGAAKSLFTPLAMAVVFSMLPSYILSRTLVPTMIRYLLPKEAELYRSKTAREAAAEAANGQPNTNSDTAPRGDFIWRIGERFDRLFEKLHIKYRHTLAWAL